MGTLSRAFGMSCILALVVLAPCASIASDIADPDSCQIVIHFAKTYSGNYRPGQPYDTITIAPGGRGETFSGTGITVDVQLRYHSGVPIVGVPREEIQLHHPYLCICPGGSIADVATVAEGWTQFSGTISGGGCAPFLTVFYTGQAIGTVPVQVNSPDNGTASPCFTDASDLATLAARLGRPEAWDLCFDYNESGPPTIVSSDLAFFAGFMGAACPP